MRGAIIVFSGLDGAGKSTQIDLLMERLHQQGEKTTYIWLRGGYTTLFGSGKAVLRRLLRKSLPSPGRSSERTQTLGKPWVRRAWLTVAILDLFRICAVQLRWWRWRGSVVICDRYIWDTLIDFRLNFPEEIVEKWLLWKILVWVTPCPTQSFLMVVPVEESVRRSQLKNVPFPDSQEVLESRLKNYSSLSECGHWYVLDGREQREVLADTIWSLSELSIKACS
jgi:thymidylate kinase